MSTITPTSDQRQIIDVTVLQVGDTVRAISGPDIGKIGVIVTPNGFIPTLVMLPTPHYESLPQGGPVPLPSSTPAMPLTSYVNVNWIDKTSSLVLLSTLRRAS